jgi:formylglycine-generating enzyme required for sulfatase activity
MLLVEGIHCPFLAQRCLAEEGKRAERRCTRYSPHQLCEGRPAGLRFCIDRFEYPNLAGVRPAVMVSFSDAERGCALEGKRLCEDDEWAMACEAPGRWPFPSGLLRDAEGCNLDRRPVAIDQRSLAIPKQTSVEVERLDQRAPSGTLGRCVSQLGVQDTTGNVAEWVRHRKRGHDPREHETALAGGGWELGAGTCRTLELSYPGDLRSPMVGFRCCAPPTDGQPTRRRLPTGFRLPRRLDAGPVESASPARP